MIRQIDMKTEVAQIATDWKTETRDSTALNDERIEEKKEESKICS